MSCKNSRDRSYIPFSRLPQHSIPHGHASKSRKLTFVQRHHFADKDPYFQRYGFSSTHVRIENWTIRKAEHWRIDAFELGLEKTLESPLYSKEIKPVNPKGNQCWIFIGRTVAEAPILWPPDGKSWLWKRHWCCARLKSKGVRGSRG